MYKNILITTDGTVLGGKALRHGLALAKSVGASVVVVTITEPWPLVEMAQRVQSEGAQAIEDYGRWAANYATA